jgi:hypothetical protein
MNRLLTSIIQLTMLAIAIPMVVAMVKDFKNGGLE